MSVGREDADFVVDDPKISSVQIQIGFAKGKFTISNLNSKIEVTLNGKKVKAKPLPIKQNDNLSMGGNHHFLYTTHGWRKSTSRSLCK